MFVIRTMEAVEPRAAWDTDALRQQANAVLALLSEVAEEGGQVPPMPLWRSWRIQRLVRRYPAVAVAWSKMVDSALMPTEVSRLTAHSADYSPVRFGLTEAEAERRERKWRERNFKHMTEAAREAHAIERRILGWTDASAAREGAAIKRLGTLKREYLPMLSQWFEGEVLARKPKSGWSVPDAPYEKIQRYPRKAAVRAWLKILAGGPVSSREYVSPQQREEMKQAAEARALLRVANALLKAPGGKAKLEKLMARMQAVA